MSRRLLTATRQYLLVVGTSFALGCASTKPSATSGPRGYDAPKRQALDQEMKKKIDEFVAMASVFIRRVGQDVKAKGHTVIFTDVGPESLERDAPEVFRDLTRKSSGDGVQVRGFSRSEIKDGVFRDKQTGEKGVGLWMVDIKDDNQGGRIITASWSDGQDKDRWHDVQYRLVGHGTKWRALD